MKIREYTHSFRQHVKLMILAEFCAKQREERIGYCITEVKVQVPVYFMVCWTTEFHLFFKLYILHMASAWKESGNQAEKKKMTGVFLTYMKKKIYPYNLNVWVYKLNTDATLMIHTDLSETSSCSTETQTPYSSKTVPLRKPNTVLNLKILNTTGTKTKLPTLRHQWKYSMTFRV